MTKELGNLAAHQLEKRAHKADNHWETAPGGVGGTTTLKQGYISISGAYHLRGQVQAPSIVHS
jgi:hypothetical protein